jgi:hypothetical protein
LQIVLNYDSGAVPAVLESISKAFGLEPYMQGMLGGLQYIGLTVSSLFAGYMLQHFSTKHVLCGSLVLNTFFCALFGLSTSTTMLMIARTGIGISQTPILIYAPVWVDEFAVGGRQTVWMSLLQAAAPLGVMVGYAMAGFLVESGVEWRWAILIQTLALTPIAIAAFFLPSQYVDIRFDDDDEVAATQGIEGTGREEGAVQRLDNSADADKASDVTTTDPDAPGLVDNPMDNQSPEDSTPRVLEFSGWKRGHVRRNWLERWFVCDLDTNTVSYFAAEDKKTCKGTIVVATAMEEANEMGTLCIRSVGAKEKVLLVRPKEVSTIAVVQQMFSGSTGGNPAELQLVVGSAARSFNDDTSNAAGGLSGGSSHGSPPTARQAKALNQSSVSLKQRRASQKNTFHAPDRISRARVDSLFSVGSSMRSSRGSVSSMANTNRWSVSSTISSLSTLHDGDGDGGVPSIPRQTNERSDSGGVEAGQDQSSLPTGICGQFGILGRSPIFICVTLGLAALFFVVTGIQFWSTDYLVKVFTISEDLQFMYFSEGLHT